MYIGCRPKYTYAYNIYTCIHTAHTYKGVRFLKKEQKHKNYVEKKKASIYLEYHFSSNPYTVMRCEDGEHEQRLRNMPC